MWEHASSLPDTVVVPDPFFGAPSLSVGIQWVFFVINKCLVTKLSRKVLQVNNLTLLLKTY